MSGIFGLDLQHSRTVVALAEFAGGRVRTHPVGDGRRALIPNAADDTGWGSDAAGLDRMSTQLYPWRADPGGIEFLRGLRGRLVAYLGGCEPTLAGGYPLCAATTDEGVLRRGAAAAGLSDLLTTDPADALLCRWLTDPAGDAEPGFRGPVIVVASGDRATTVGEYEVVRTEERLSVRRGPGHRVDAGSAAWSDRLCAEVLDRCRGVLPRSSLHLLDAALEYGARMHHTPAGLPLPWRGVLADHMTTPLRLSRAEMASWDEVTRAVRAVTAALTSPAASRGQPVVVVGGLGAIWPFLADELTRFGTVWSSTEPEFDIAIGAAWWPALSSRFTNAPTSPAAPGSAVAMAAPSAPAGVLPPPQRQPPSGRPRSGMPCSDTPRSDTPPPPWHRS